MLTAMKTFQISPPIFLGVSLSIPHFGHVGADDETSAPHSLHFRRATLRPLAGTHDGSRSARSTTLRRV